MFINAVISKSINPNVTDEKISLIEYLINNGVTIPHYCYHDALPIVGNCRACLVELQDSQKPLAACTANAKTILSNKPVYHDSPFVLKSRENVIEFLLLNHPLDCPICDQGGDCDLQDQSLFFGVDKRRFYSYKRVVDDKNLGPVVKTVMTRCIHCTKCVRFMTHVAGTEELGVLGRGAGSEIGTYIEQSLFSEISGNIIDICPVGSLTSSFLTYSVKNFSS